MPNVTIAVVYLKDDGTTEGITVRQPCTASDLADQEENSARLADQVIRSVFRKLRSADLTPTVGR